MELTSIKVQPIKYLSSWYCRIVSSVYLRRSEDGVLTHGEVSLTTDTKGVVEIGVDIESRLVSLVYLQVTRVGTGQKSFSSLSLSS